MAATSIIGIDFSTNPKNIGVAYGEVAGDNCRILRTSDGRDLVEKINQEISCTTNPTIIAIDAPLGWPDELRSGLASHRAGEALESRENPFFRATDRFIHDNTGKQPLAVGANLIAHTARAACNFLVSLRRVTGDPVPLAWSPEDLAPISVIEVYPAATLRQLGVDTAEYKRPEAVAKRQAMLAQLPIELAFTPPEDRDLTDDWLDSLCCVVAAHDFLRNDCWSPPDEERAKREGWIWVRR